LRDAGSGIDQSRRDVAQGRGRVGGSRRSAAVVSNP
jgi:hypothetical protein